jgi:hypothetical protein
MGKIEWSPSGHREHGRRERGVEVRVEKKSRHTGRKKREKKREKRKKGREL